MTKRAFKDKVYGELSKITKAMGNPHRLEIIDLLGQGPFSVEQIANHTGMPIANASQHLQVLKSAKLVSIARDGNFILYSLAGENVFNAWAALRALGMVYNAEVEKVVSDFRKGYGPIESIDAETLIALLEKDKIILLDVRPAEEYNRGHIHRALCAPIAELSSILQTLPKSKTVIAYCRGPFCVFADEAVSLLKKKGYKAQRLSEGFPDWAAKGYPIATK
ncbi:metalloregulator ArsR/SmtB family transcription factor [Chitinophaga polysaccharea]|uniref:ArsR/SmtB family transcription factor n=1 Tax=Chitinophaga polysaccharea TaxID=1293035 RepID=UPI001455462F|nr:metalloregulator ArsR/SmtB family transcription factor [Chitinophaga polysaccharea]NLR60303.1 metalloregulator ArsR/SmtB family transcription factor [Chitinophaga polysaccharea]